MLFPLFVVWLKSFQVVSLDGLIMTVYDVVDIILIGALRLDGFQYIDSIL